MTNAATRSFSQSPQAMETLGRAFNLSAGEQSHLPTCDRQGILGGRNRAAALDVVASEAEHRLATSDPAEIAALREDER